MNLTSKRQTYPFLLPQAASAEPLNDTVKELTARAELHDQIDVPVTHIKN